MKKITFALLLFMIASCHQQVSDDETLPQAIEANEGYDEELATRLKADEYGMSQYVMAFLKKGPNRTMDEEKAAELQAAHMANIRRLAAADKLVLAGPFLDDGELRGIYIFNVTSVDEARELTKSDPAIQAGSLVMELHPWYGSAAVKEINSLHPRLAKTKF